MTETFATAFDQALGRRQVSMSWLRDRLAARGYAISLTTLSYWRSGQRVPTRSESMDALSEIEALLEVRDGSLGELAYQARRGRGTPAPFDSLALDTVAGELRGEAEVERVLFHLVVDVDRGAGTIVSTLTQLFVALRDGVEGVSLFVGPDADGTGNSTRAEAVAGCSVGDVVDRDDGIRTAWLRFERPCRAGESALTQTRLIDAGPQVETETEYGVVAEQRLEDCMIWVRFRPDDVPARCWVAHREGETRAEWEVDLDGLTSVHHRLTAFGPGICRVRWEW